MDRNIAVRKMGCLGRKRWALKQKQYTIPISHTPHSPVLCRATLIFPRNIIPEDLLLQVSVLIYKGCSYGFQGEISVTLVDNFQPCAAHSNSLLILYILLTVNGMQNSVQPVLQISQQDVSAVYQLLGVGFLLHQLVCLPRDEMKISPRREPNIIAYCLVSFHGTPVAALVPATTVCVSITKAAAGCDLAIFNSVFQPRQFPEPCP